MNTILTPQLLDFLMEKGYRYCLSKTSSTGRDDVSTCISLKPVTQKPQSKISSEEYDTWYTITEEPLQMATSIDDRTIVIVSLNDDDTKACPYRLNVY